jgi:hypothetical protein
MESLKWSFGPDEGPPVYGCRLLQGKKRLPVLADHHHRKSFGIPTTLTAYEKTMTFSVSRLQDKNRTPDQWETVALTADTEEIWNHIGGKIKTSSMTTTGSWAPFQPDQSLRLQEADLNLMTGGPDGIWAAMKSSAMKAESASSSTAGPSSLTRTGSIKRN